MSAMSVAQDNSKLIIKECPDLILEYSRLAHQDWQISYGTIENDLLQEEQLTLFFTPNTSQSIDPPNTLARAVYWSALLYDTVDPALGCIVKELLIKNRHMRTVAAAYAVYYWVICSPTERTEICKFHDDCYRADGDEYDETLLSLARILCAHDSSYAETANNMLFYFRVCALVVASQPDPKVQVASASSVQRCTCSIL